MKRLLVGVIAVSLVATAVAFSNLREFAADLQLKVEDRNPWNHLRLNNGSGEFQFAIVSDRTGGHREKIFSLAVEQLNLLQPEFVVSVGDLIEGYTEDPIRLSQEWREFQSFIGKLEMPFFYVPGNHDIANLAQEGMWKEKFGRRYYHFLYRDVLFLALCSEDPPKSNPANISEEQIAYVKAALEENRNARWTFVFLHKPMWAEGDPAKNGWLEVEKLLAGRQYTVFAGHVHRYQKFVRNGMNYYQLATTGGGSKLRGPEYGEFDHIVWITMKQDGPVLANIMLDGILPESLRRPVTVEPGVPTSQRAATQRVRGLAHFDGCPIPGAQLVFQTADKEVRPQVRADCLVEADGSFVPSTYTAGDGLPAGEYLVTVVWRKPRFDVSGRPGPNQLPDRYARADTTPLRITIKGGQNDIRLELTSAEKQ